MTYLISTAVALFLALLLVSPAGAQPGGRRVYYLDLSKEGLEVPGRMVYVEQVVDGRPSQAAIGMVYPGLNSSPVPVLFSRGLAPELTALVQRRLPRRPNDQPVVLCVRQLRLNELQNRGNGLVKADLVADAYLHQPDGYHFVGRLSNFIGESDRLLALGRPGKVALLLARSVEQLSTANWAAAAQRPALVLAQLPTDAPVGTVRPAIVRAALPRRGVYMNFSQFLANQPDSTIQLVLDTVGVHQPGWEGTTQLRPRMRWRSSTRESVREVWGFSDGRQAYIRQLKAYRPLQRQGNAFMFVGGAPVDREATSKRSTNMFMYGAIGAMTMPVDDQTDRPMTYALDLGNGQVAPYPAPGQPARADTAFIYVYRPPGGSPEPRRLLLNNYEVGRLKPGQYLELSSSHVGQLLRLSEGSIGGPTLLLIPDAGTANYIRLNAGNARSPWQWMPSRQGEAEVDALEKQR